MNFKLLLKITSRILLIEAVFLIFPLGVSLYFRQDDWKSFVATILILLAVSSIIFLISRNAQKGIHAREGFLVVGLSWLLLALFGALPFVFSGYVPSYVDAVFETISGFTTTGASILPAVEDLPNGLLLWRSLTNWLGGMGVLILFLALLPSMGAGTIQLLRAESPGITPTKLVPKIGQTAKILYIIYTVITLSQVIALMLAGMPLFDSVNHAMATAGTGGFGIKNLSIGHYNSPLINVIVGSYMIIFGINFAIFFQIIKKKFTSVIQNTELKVYIGILVVSVILISIDILPLFESVGMAVNHAFFQVSTIMTTTGFATTDFAKWPEFSQIILFVLMLTGACAGSTAGGLKVIRISLVLKVIYREIQRIVHPRSIKVIRADKRAVPDEVVNGVLYFCVTYALIAIVATVLVTLDNFNFTTSVTAVIACLSNIGPGLDMVGPMGNYSAFSDFSKIVLSLCMLIGRLEIFPILVLITPISWKKT